MSPEQARGRGSAVDGRTDIYALGAILYELLTRVPPFQGNQSEVVRAVIEGAPQPPRQLDRSIPRDLETICLKALEKEPSRRYATAQEMSVDLRRFLRGDTILARRAGPMRKGWRWVRRHPVVVAASVLLLAAIGASVAYAMHAERRSRVMLGYRTIVLETSPPGAKLAFIPLNKTTGEPELEKMVPGVSVSPVRQELLPNDYLVVAVMKDGRFHEVLRRVPAKGEVFVGYSHRSVKMQNDGSLSLRTIEIPGREVAKDMALIEGSDSFVLGGTDGEVFKHRTVRSFHMSSREFTVGDYFRVNSAYPIGKDASSAGEVYSCPYDRAVQQAEDLGMRLPTEEEYEFAATRGGRQRYPWGDEFPANEFEQTTAFSTAEFDRLPTEPAVFGLCSNKAEWTSSPPGSLVSIPMEAGPVGVQDSRIVRGGDLSVVHGNPEVSSKTRDPRTRTVVARQMMEPGLGFRLVRSATPLVRYDDLP
jgi:serine/threonine-protein kinase